VCSIPLIKEFRKLLLPEATPPITAINSPDLHVKLMSFSVFKSLSLIYSNSEAALGFGFPEGSFKLCSAAAIDSQAKKQFSILMLPTGTLVSFSSIYFISVHSMK